MSKTLSKTLGLGLPALAEMIRAKGRGKDTILAHITPREAALLKKRGGAGTINPDTGLLEFEDDTYDPNEDMGDVSPVSPIYDVVDESGNFQPTFEDPFLGPQDVGPSYVPGYFPEDNFQISSGGGNENLPERAPANYVATGDNQVFDTQAQRYLTPEQVAAANPQLYPEGVLPRAGQETVFTPEGRSYYQNLTPISTVKPPKTKEELQKDKDYSNLLSQLLRLGLGAGTAYALTRGVQQPAAKKAEEQAQTAKNERMAIAAPYQGIGKGLIAGAQAGNLSASNIQAVKAARAMAAQNISRTGGVGVLQGANSIADLEARLLDNQLIQGIKIANIGDNYAINAIQAGMQADKELAASQADFAKQLSTLLAPMVLGYSPTLPSGLPGTTQSLQNPGLINTIADAGGNLLNSGGNAVNSLVS